MPLEHGAGDQRRHSASESVQPVVVPVVREFAKVGKRRVETGRVRIRKSVKQKRVRIDEPLLEESAEIQRIPVNQPVAVAPPVRRDGDTLIIPVLEEVLTVTKQLVLKEEIHVRKRARRVHKPQSITLNTEEVEVRRDRKNAKECPK